MEFFNNDIKNKPAKDVMKVFHKMFKDFKNQKLNMTTQTPKATLKTSRDDVGIGLAISLRPPK